VFAPRTGPSSQRRTIFLYVNPTGEKADGALGTTQNIVIPGPPVLPGENQAPWNVVSWFCNAGYRPIVPTLNDESPRPNGDFVTIRFGANNARLLRTTKLSQISSPNDWNTSATSESDGALVFQQGPDLPNSKIDIVQPSGGHDNPIFYVSDQGFVGTNQAPTWPNGQKHLWKWTSGLEDWQPIIPGPIINGRPVPQIARRFFVDPYRPDLIYVLDTDHILRSDDSGNSWIIDYSLEKQLTENGAFPLDVNIPNNVSPGEELLRDMQFDPINPKYRFAVGPAGVFYTVDGLNWKSLIRTSAIPMHPNNMFYDVISDPCIRSLYVATSNLGLLRLTGLPPDSPYPIGSVIAAQGKVKLLRVHEVGSKYGPPGDELDVEVIIWLDSEPNRSFGFQLRNDTNETAHKKMLDVLRDAFNNDSIVRIEYIRKGCTTGEIIRVNELL
jgi:hypothetical protein